MRLKPGWAANETIALQQESSWLSLRLLQQDLTDYVHLFACIGRLTDRFEISISLNVLFQRKQIFFFCFNSAELVNSKHEVVVGIIELVVRYLTAEKSLTTDVWGKNISIRARRKILALCSELQHFKGCCIKDCACVLRFLVFLQHISLSV